MPGYIALTDSNWVENQKLLRNSEVVFWRRKTSFVAIKESEPFFFLGKKNSAGKRMLLGVASYKRHRLMSADEAWEYYGNKLGFPQKAQFLEKIGAFYKESCVNLGCIELNNVTFFRVPVDLDNCKVNFSPYIVSGKTITDDECQSIYDRLIAGEEHNED